MKPVDPFRGKSTRRRGGKRMAKHASQAGQAIVEAALAIPILLTFAFGIVALGRLMQAQSAVEAVAREAASVCVQQVSAGACVALGRNWAQGVAEGYGLSQQRLQINIAPGSFARGARVSVTASYTLSLADLPLLELGTYTVHSTQEQQVEVFRSR